MGRYFDYEAMDDAGRQAESDAAQAEAEAQAYQAECEAKEVDPDVQERELIAGDEQHIVSIKRRDECAFCGIKQSTLADLQRKAKAWDAVKQLCDDGLADSFVLNAYQDGDWRATATDGRCILEDIVGIGRSAEDAVDSLMKQIVAKGEKHE